MNSNARILILGSMPGVESLRKNQYYAFPRNAFWKIMSSLLRFDPQIDYEERLRILREAGIALWDVLGTCTRRGSSDSAIENPVPNDIPGLLAECPCVRLVLCNGSASYALLKRSFPALFLSSGLDIRRMPSTSPAAAALSFEQKLQAYREAMLSILLPNA